MENSRSLLCRVCNAEIENGCHCADCLSAEHEECGGTLQPITVWVKDDDSWDIVAKCSLCGEIVSYPSHEKDSPLKLLSLAAKPLGVPPFPIERAEKLTDMMGGNGNTGGFFQ